MVDPASDDPALAPARLLARPVAVEPVGVERDASALPRARVALAHDWLVTCRGGEQVLEAIARAIDATCDLAALYVLTDSGARIAPRIDAMPKRTSMIQRVPGGAGPVRRWLLPLFPLGVRSLSRALARDHAERPIDLLISSSSCAIKQLRTPSVGGRAIPHLCYCHAPARYVWSLREDCSRGSLLRRAGLAAYAGRFRAWDRDCAHITRFLANSSHTARMIERAYGRSARVVHPPVDTAFFTPGDRSERDDFWLVVCALEPYKRVDLAIEAARGARLIIVGRGSQRTHLMRRAHRGVEFVGHVERERLRALYRSARGLLFPQVEDFGIAAGEAQACGCPVVARAQGGALDIVRDGVTGAMFHAPASGDRDGAMVDAMREAMARVEGIGPRACRSNAERFSYERFAREIAEEVGALVR